MKDSMLDVIHDTAKDLRDAGVMDMQTMREFDVLCLPKVEALDAQTIKLIRERARVSQAVFAAYLNTSASTVRQWEQGSKKPRGTSLKLLNLIARKGLDVLI
ncbi:helix-turn-helix domain-containing protein [Pseudidiomarina sp. YC-516-91]|jgi:putative transcriptional regulator|uniref:helix-turn-helix domain-containing protein n=1 Tax=Pseudidiomarina salilacus TaxID=3384452 RepID=UPI00398485E1